MRFSASKQTIRRVLSGVGILLLLTAGCALRKGRPAYEGQISGKPVQGPVQILRDGEGVPHIFAASAPDLFFGLGYAMAQDRLFQMDLYRLAGLGRLSERFGNLSLGEGVKLVHIDMLLKCFQLPERAERAFPRLPPDSRVLLEQFTAGINQLIADRKGALPVEYRLLRFRPEPWTVTDVMTIPELFGMGLALINVETELLRDAMAHVAGDARAADFYERYGGRVGASAEGAVTAPGDDDLADAVPALRRAVSLLRMFMPQGSNNWAVAGDLTPSGLPLLASDPHVPLGPAPSFWYHAHLHAPDLSVEGMLYTGYPAFGAGWNGRVAWGVTNVMADQIDLFRVGQDPRVPNQYRTEEGWRRFEPQEARCKVRFGRDRTFTIRKGIYGFLVPPEALENRYVKKAPWLRDPLCVRYVETDPAAYFQGQVMLMRAGGGAEVTEALRKISAGPSAFNYVWASREGSIGYQMVGRIPIRPYGQGSRVRDAREAEYPWDGYIPFDRLVAVRDPEDGILVTANQRIAPRDYPWYITDDYVRPLRSSRIRQLLEDSAYRSPEGFKRAQADVYNLGAGPVLERLGEAVRRAREAGRTDTATEEAWRVLDAWDRQTVTGSPGAALFEIFYQRFLENTFCDELTEELAEILTTVNLAPAKVMDTLLDEPDNPWFDRVGTEAREDRDQILLESLEEAARRARKRMGKDPAAWSWGAIHVLHLQHPFGYIPLFGRPYRIGRLPFPGDNDTVNAGYFFAHGGRYTIFAGAASRMVVDLSRPEGAWFNCSTGMAGEPPSEYFKNLTPGWYKGEYFWTSLAERPEEVDADQRLTLRP